MQHDVLTRLAPVRPSSVDAEARTFEAVISTGAAVQRGGFVEILDLDAVDPATLAGLPVLDSHRQTSGRDVLGRIVSARREGDSLIAAFRLSEAADVAPIIARLGDGTLTDFSIGYRVADWREGRDAAGRRTRTAIRWEITEVSIVPRGADPRAKRRGDMPEEQIDEMTRAERERVDGIRSIGRAAGLGDDWTASQIDGEVTVDAARAAAKAELRKRQAPAVAVRTVTHESRDDWNVERRHREDALFARMSGEPPAEHARDYMGAGFSGLARACLEAGGQSTRNMGREDMVRAAMHTTSDFAQTVTASGNRYLLKAHEAAASPIKTTLARQSTVADKRPKTGIRISGLGLLEKVGEAGEITATTATEATESYRAETLGRRFNVSRDVFINDDVGALTGPLSMLGRAAAETENNLLASLLLSNPKMGETGKALFSATHGNLASAADGGDWTALHITTLAKGRRTMRELRDLDGKTRISAAPRYLLIGPALELFGEQILTELQASTPETVNPFPGKLTLLVDPRIEDSRWYLFADPATLPVLEYAYLASAPGPQLASREGWEVLGMEFRVVLDFGAGAVDWRGAYMNPGAA